MPLDPNIPLSFRPAELQQPAQVMGQMLSLKNMQQQNINAQQQNQLGQVQLQDANINTAIRQRGLEGSRFLAQTIPQFTTVNPTDGTVKVDHQAVARAVEVQYPDVAAAYAKNAAELEDSFNKSADAKYTHAQAGNAFLAKLIGTATDQATWNANIGIAQAMGIPTEGIPETFTPEVRNTLAKNLLGPEAAASIDAKQAETKKNIAEAGKFDREGNKVSESPEFVTTSGKPVLRDEYGHYRDMAGHPLDPSQVKVKPPQNMFGSMFGAAQNLGLRSTTGLTYTRDPTVLAKLPTPIANKVKSIVDGELPLPPVSIRNPDSVLINDAVFAYDPTYDASKAAARRQTVSDLRPAGKIGQGINAYNTALLHGQVLLGLVNKLDNGKIRRYNGVANYLNSEFGDPAVKEFNNAMQKFSMELVRAWRGVSGNEADIKENINAMGSADSKESLLNVLADNVELLHGKVGETEEQVSSTMNEPTHLLSAKSLESIRRIYTAAKRPTDWIDAYQAEMKGGTGGGAPAPTGPTRSTDGLTVTAPGKGTVTLPATATQAQKDALWNMMNGVSTPPPSGAAPASSATTSQRAAGSGRLSPAAPPPPQQSQNAAAKAPSAADLAGLAPGHGRTFHAGAFNGQTWTVDAQGNPQQVR